MKKNSESMKMCSDENTQDIQKRILFVEMFANV